MLLARTAHPIPTVRLVPSMDSHLRPGNVRRRPLVHLLRGWGVRAFPSKEVRTTQGATESKPPPIVLTSTWKNGDPSTISRKSGNYGLLPCNTPAEEEADSTLTAAHAEVESLVRTSPGNAQATTVVPPSNTAAVATDPYWAEKLSPQVDQTMVPKFTPSSFQLFLRAIIQIFDLLIKDMARGEHRNGHMALSTIAGFLAPDGKATSWLVFNGWNTNEITHALMTYGVYTLTLKRVNMRNYLTFFILGVEGVVRAMKEFCDFAGAVFAMDANSPPVVSIHDIMIRAEEHAPQNASILK